MENTVDWKKVRTARIKAEKTWSPDSKLTSHQKVNGRYKNLTIEKPMAKNDQMEEFEIEAKVQQSDCANGIKQIDKADQLLLKIPVGIGGLDSKIVRTSALFDTGFTSYLIQITEKVHREIGSPKFLEGAESTAELADGSKHTKPVCKVLLNLGGQVFETLAIVSGGGIDEVVLGSSILYFFNLNYVNDQLFLVLRQDKISKLPPAKGK